MESRKVPSTTSRQDPPISVDDLLLGDVLLDQGDPGSAPGGNQLKSRARVFSTVPDPTPVFMEGDPWVENKKQNKYNQNKNQNKKLVDAKNMFEKQNKYNQNLKPKKETDENRKQNKKGVEKNKKHKEKDSDSESSRRAAVEEDDGKDVGRRVISAVESAKKIAMMTKLSSKSTSRDPSWTCSTRILPVGDLRASQSSIAGRRVAKSESREDSSPRPNPIICSGST